MHLELDDVRRLTGPNLIWDKPGAIVDVFITGIDQLSVAKTWQKWTTKLLSELSWQETTTYRLFDGGASLVMSAKDDLLYSACDIAEFAWLCTVDELTQVGSSDWQTKVSELKQSALTEANPALIDFIKTAQAHHTAYLVDDDQVSLGYGKYSQSWEIDAIPKLQTLNWDSYKTVPLGLITGTNGKSTSVRLAACIAKMAGINAGVTSTDFIKVGDDIIDTGDYSGPGGARMLLRDKRTEMAFLEVARGGILRRGLPIPSANAALVTNAASDHLGQYGINTVDEIAQVKLVVAKAISAHSTLVLNGDDPLLVKHAGLLNVPICWFSVAENNPLIKEQLKKNLPCVFMHNNHVIYSHTRRIDFGHVNNITMTMQGTAQHNIQNALGVIGLSIAMGIPVDAIRKGLVEFGSTAQDNPGRGNIYHCQDVNVVVDFAHNGHSMRSVMAMAANMPAKRRIVMFSHAGDRSNKDILEVTDSILAHQPDIYILSELEAYLRGREHNEITALVEQHLIDNGVSEKQIIKVASPLAGAKSAMKNAQSGDLVLLFTLSERQEISELLNTYQ